MDKLNGNLERRERDPTMHSSPVCDLLRTGGTYTDAHLGGLDRQALRILGQTVYLKTIQKSYKNQL